MTGPPVFGLALGRALHRPLVTRRLPTNAKPSISSSNSPVQPSTPVVQIVAMTGFREHFECSPRVSIPLKSTSSAPRGCRYSEKALRVLPGGCPYPVSGTSSARMGGSAPRIGHLECSGGVSIP